MAKRVAPAANDGARVPRDSEAALLAHLLRLSPLTLLHGEAGAGKTTLITHDLLPLLQRRVRDRPRTSARVGRVVMPFPDRRRSVGLGEITVVADRWDGDPLARLRARIDSALGAPPDPEPSLAVFLDGAARRHGLRFLLILDHFDTLLETPPEPTPGPPFIEALIALLNLPDTPVHVFVVLRDPSHPRLRPLHNRVCGFGDRWLRVRHWQLAADTDPPALRLVMLPPAAAPSTPLIPAQAGTPDAPAAAPPAAEPVPSGHARTAVIAGALMFAAGLGMAWWLPRERPPAGPPDVPVASVAVPPPFGIALDTEGGPAPPMAGELARALSPAGRGTPAIVPPGAAASFALMRYDELQWRRRLEPGAGLQVVAPLHRETVHVLVPARSPLVSMADLRGRRINTGPPDGARASTSHLLYERLTGAPLADDTTDTRPAPAAIAELRLGRGPDAIVLVGDLPAALAPLPPELRRLPLYVPGGRFEPAARALKAFLPAKADGQPTVASMVFLVATPAATGTLIAESVRALCERLPALRRDGHPAWRDVRPGTPITTGWPDAPAAIAARSACEPAVPPSPSHPTQEPSR
jgi:hypothetical protein